MHRCRFSNFLNPFPPSWGGKKNHFLGRKIGIVGRKRKFWEEK
jgi:hypothetical protein